MHNLLEDKTKIPLRASRGLKDKSPLKLWLPRKHIATQLSDVFISRFSQEDENSLESTSWRTLQSTVVTLNAYDYHGYRFATWSRDEMPANPAKPWQQNRHSRKNNAKNLETQRKQKVFFCIEHYNHLKHKMIVVEGKSGWLYHILTHEENERK